MGTKLSKNIINTKNNKVIKLKDDKTNLFEETLKDNEYKQTLFRSKNMFEKKDEIMDRKLIDEINHFPKFKESILHQKISNDYLNTASSYRYNRELHDSDIKINEKSLAKGKLAIDQVREIIKLYYFPSNNSTNSLSIKDLIKKEKLGEKYCIDENIIENIIYNVALPDIQRPSKIDEYAIGTWPDSKKIIN